MEVVDVQCRAKLCMLMKWERNIITHFKGSVRSSCVLILAEMIMFTVYDERSYGSDVPKADQQCKMKTRKNTHTQNHDAFLRFDYLLFIHSPLFIYSWTTKWMNVFLFCFLLAPTASQSIAELKCKFVPRIQYSMWNVMIRWYELTAFLFDFLPWMKIPNFQNVRKCNSLNVYYQNIQQEKERFAK